MTNELININDPDVQASAQELKEYFLQNAKGLVQQYVDAAIGTSTLASTNSDARKEVWDVLKKLILSSSDRLGVEIDSVESILRAVSQGKCTFEEGEKLLDLFKKAKEISTMGKLPAGGKGALEGGLNISISTGGGAAQPITIAPAGDALEHG